MIQRRRIFLYGLILCLTTLSGCKKEKDQPTSSEIKAESEKLYSFFSREFETELRESPMLQTKLGIKENYSAWDDFSHLKYAEDLEQAKRKLAYLKDSVDRAALTEEAALSYQLFKRQFEQEVEDYPFRLYNYPVNQLSGIHTGLPAFLINMHQIESPEDAQAYLSRLRKIPKVIEDIIKGLELREMNQIMPPKFVFSQSIEASKNIISGRPFEKSVDPSPLLADFKEKVEGVDIEEKMKKELVIEVQHVLLDSVKPAYEKLIDKLEDQSQRATEDHGVWKFPKGDKYYQTILKRMTTTDLTPEDIHQIGLEEVARIHKEMEELMQRTGFEGSLQDFFKFMREDEQFYYDNSAAGRTHYLARAKEVIDAMKSKLDTLFVTRPQADLVVKAVEPFREKSAGKAFYEPPALDGSRPGTYYVNLYNMDAMPKYQLEALAYHEGIPGHHMQIALTQELEDLPMFRRLLLYPAYVEGWALYAEVLPKEIGFYQDPYSDFGRLAMELWRSIRLVVDTGIHDQKWTREEAIEYYKSNSPNPESDIIKMVERHIVLPGQATAYKVGMIKIMDLRARAESELGKKFDLRDFHDVVLRDGPVPLDVLEQRVDQWIQRSK